MIFPELPLLLLLLGRDLTMSLVTSLHFLQTQAHATTFCLCGHRSSLSSTRFIISPNNSGNILPHPSDSPPDSPTSRPDSTPFRSFLFWLLNDLENLRDKNDLLSDIRRQADGEKEREESKLFFLFFSSLYFFSECFSPKTQEKKKHRGGSFSLSFFLNLFWLEMETVYKLVWLYDVNLDRRMGDLTLNRWREDIN